jgi:hypothetical protein
MVDPERPNLPASGAAGVPLIFPLPLMVEPLLSSANLAPGATHGQATDPALPWLWRSGTFFLPTTQPIPVNASSWLARGWPAGDDAFHVTRADGTDAILYFNLAGSAS